VLGRVTRGVPTSVHAGCLAGLFPLASLFPPASSVSVWPCDSGDLVSGEGLLPVYPSVARAARGDVLLYKLMALVDVVRVGSPAERRSAAELLKKTIVGDERRR
jgi:hypothetical protein